MDVPILVVNNIEASADKSNVKDIMSYLDAIKLELIAAIKDKEEILPVTSSAEKFFDETND